MDIQHVLRRLSDAALSGQMRALTQQEHDRRTLGPLAYRIKYGRCRSADRSAYDLTEPATAKTTIPCVHPLTDVI